MESLETKSRLGKIVVNGKTEKLLKIDGTLSISEIEETICSSDILKGYVGMYGKEKVKVIIYQ